MPEGYVSVKISTLVKRELLTIEEGVGHVILFPRDVIERGDAASTRAIVAKYKYTITAIRKADRELGICLGQSATGFIVNAFVQDGQMTCLFVSASKTVSERLAYVIYIFSALLIPEDERSSKLTCL